MHLVHLLFAILLVMFAAIDHRLSHILHYSIGSSEDGAFMARLIGWLGVDVTLDVQLGLVALVALALSLVVAPYAALVSLLVLIALGAVYAVRVDQKLRRLTALWLASVAAMQPVLGAVAVPVADPSTDAVATAESTFTA